MARRPRFICPGVPHHIVQRGNRRGQVFFSDADRRTYLAWLRLESRQHGVEVLAYCLMTNHVHLVAVPLSTVSIARALKELNMRYAQRLNRMRQWTGHTWQGRYFSAPLDERYCWAALRYVERNPVRAGLVARAQAYEWSSARAHCESAWDPVLSADETWANQLRRVRDWSAWLSEGESTSETSTIRGQTSRGLPCGSTEFIARLEKQAGRVLQVRRRGRPRSST